MAARKELLERIENGSKAVAAPGFKKWGGKKGATIDYGGGKHVRVAHIASAKREPIFLNCWGPFFFLGKHVRGAHIASA